MSRFQTPTPEQTAAVDAAIKTSQIGRAHV